MIMKRDDLVVLMTFNRVNDANLNQALLRSAGVESYLLDENMGTLLPVGGAFEIRLAVARENEAKAREVLAADFDKEDFKKETKTKR